MPDQPALPDIHTPLPDEAHEALRAGLVAALDRLEQQVTRINDAWLLLSVNADFAQAVLNTTRGATATLTQVQGEIAVMSQTVTDLAVRVAVLEGEPSV